MLLFGEERLKGEQKRKKKKEKKKIEGTKRPDNPSSPVMTYERPAQSGHSRSKRGGEQKKEKKKKKGNKKK
jgi:hypothetical protein